MRCLPVSFSMSKTLSAKRRCSLLADGGAIDLYLLWNQVSERRGRLLVFVGQDLGS